MDQLEFLKLVVRLLEQTDLAYMVVGSYASGYWGEPRSTYDLDVVISLLPVDVPRVCDLFPDDQFYVSRHAAMQAAQSGGQFNVIHPDSGNKIDFMIQQQTPWGKQQIARRQRVEFDTGFHCYVGAPEDIILSKLLYYREGESSKHLRDIAGMLKVSGDKIDRAYITGWAASLDVLDLWKDLAARTGF